MISYQKANHIFQAKDWLISAWKLFKKKPLTWVFMILIFDIFVIVGNNFLIGKFIVALLLPALVGGIFIALDKAHKNEPIGLENLFLVFKNKPLLKEMLTVGVIGVGIVALITILQMVTGTEYEVKVDATKVEGAGDVFKQVSEGSFFTFIVSWGWWCAILFGIPLVAIKKVSAIPALKHSLAGSLLNIVPLFVFLAITFLLVIVSILPVGLGLLVLIPILFGATYFAFKEIYIGSEVENASEIDSEFTSSIGVIGEAIKEPKEKSVVYTGKKEHQESDLKEAYRQAFLTKLLGMALITIGVISAAYTFYSLQVGTNTTGEVLSVKENRSRSSSGGTSYTYLPTFSFTDMHGEKHIAPTAYASSELNYPVGARVKISYNPDDYSTVRINSIKSILYLPMFFWLFGVPILWLSIKGKKDIDENGVPPRKSVFLKEGFNESDAVAEMKDSGKVSVASVEENANKTKQDNIELVLPKKFTLDFYDEYMHITLSWFGKRTFAATLFAVFQLAFFLIMFSKGAGALSNVNSSILVWVFAISGFGFLYYALTTWLNKTHIFVSQNALEIKHKPIPWFGNKRISTKNIKQLYAKKVISSSSSSSRTTVSYYLHVISFDEDDLTLLKVENADQALFLEQEIEKYLGIKDLRVRGEIG